MLPIIILSLLLVTKLRADVSEFFDNNLTIESPLGTLFPGEHAQFVCIAKNFEGDGKLVWHWHFTNRSTLHMIEPESDELDKSNGDFLRRSVIRVPDSSSRIAYIGCEFSTEGHLYTKLMPLDILKTPSPITFRNHYIIYPQIALEVYSPEIRRPELDAPMTSLNSSSYRHSAYLVTNKSINLSHDAKSIRLSCIIPKHQQGEYRWVISTSGHISTTNDSKKQSANRLPSISLVLNRMSLIYREAVLAGRLPNCGDNTTDSSRRQFPFLPYDDTVSDTIEILLSPLVTESETLTYTCEPINKTGNPQNTAYTKIMLLATRNGMQMQERDQEFLQLINILMQILQSSSGGVGGPNSDGGSGGGSGPIYGVGFGSSTIMILMGVTIFYLKRQLNQIQEQVREHDEERKKLNRSSRPVNETGSSEL